MTTAQVIVVASEGQRYIFVFRDEDDVAELRRVVGRFAADPGLSFTWLDAAVVVQKAEAWLASIGR